MNTNAAFRTAVSYSLNPISDNVKALFRRAQAHVAVWNPEEARKDYERIKTLDSTLINMVNKELKNLDERVKQKNDEDKAKFMGKLF